MRRKPASKKLTMRQVRAMVRRATRCQVHFDGTEPMVDMLEELVASGLYGTSKHEAARRLVEDGLRRHRAEGIFLRRPRR